MVVTVVVVRVVVVTVLTVLVVVVAREGNEVIVISSMSKLKLSPDTGNSIIPK